MSSDSSIKEQSLKNITSDINKIQQDLEAAIRARDMAYQENRRLQDDLASCATDNKRTHTELDIARRQVDDLKRQLQHYVAEVKRTEDLISQKEIERSEMLDHFKSLSQEATVLESNNHSLETEAAETKVQLSVALDHVADLERKIEMQETMIRDYEKQISDLAAQIAKMEFQIVQQTATSDKLEAELSSMKELCVKLDKQKDTLLKQLNEKEVSKAQIDRDLQKLRRDSEQIQSSLGKERDSVENLERLLALSRQETVEQRLLNQELQKEVQKLKENLQELQTKLVTTTEQLDIFQEKALDYSQQNKQLRREITNERFYRAREDEGKRYRINETAAIKRKQNTETTSKHSTSYTKEIQKRHENPLSNYDSMVQISTNTTLSSVPSPEQHILSPSVNVSSSSSENEIAVYNHEISTSSNSNQHKFSRNSVNLPSINDMRESPTMLPKFTGSISQNLINRNIDEGSRISSKLGIVSNKNKLENQTSLEKETISSKYKKKVSLSKHSQKTIDEEQPRCDTISAGPALVGESGSNVTSMSKKEETLERIKSVSKYGIDSEVERIQMKSNKDLSALGIVSEEHTLVDASTDPAGQLKETIADIPMKDISQEKSSQVEVCECWKVCTCKPRIGGGPTYEYVRPVVHAKCGHYHQTITCVITNNRIPLNCYTTNYSIGYENLSSTQGPKT